ncbi:hypothetical protein D9758_011484 [Tetrapyrgos nigripes]|uniref:HAD-like protein n=1 Tax=Tetrapyrgos nigripes TaxID=182062 RepID=A0A8H5CSM9_9AGAR|nr:hypothetical protein D9758_011484 [Tetrapyrgos nigripes]
MPGPVQYVLFDMDGLMIDSERIYSDVTNSILAPYGKEQTWDIKAGCMGKPERAAALHLLSFFPDIDLDLETYLKERNRLQDLAWPTVPLLPGTRKLVLHLKKHSIPIAIATGSRRRNYELKTRAEGAQPEKREVFEAFEEKVACGDDTQYGMRGKPNPDVFLVAAKELLGRNVGKLVGVDEEGSEYLTKEQLDERAKGLVFEDALPGMQAGKRAGMNVIWVPDPNLLDVEYTGKEKADQTLESLEDFRPEEWGLPPYDELS